MLCKVDYFYDCTVRSQWKKRFERTEMYNKMCKLNIYYRNLQIQGSRYERRRSRSKVDSFYNCKILKDKGVLRMCKYSIKVKYDIGIWYKVLDTKGEELWIQCTKIHYGCRLLQKCCIIVYLIRRFNGTWPSRFWRLFFNMLEIARLFLLRLVTLDVMSCV